MVGERIAAELGAGDGPNAARFPGARRPATTRLALGLPRPVSESYPGPAEFTLFPPFTMSKNALGGKPMIAGMVCLGPSSDPLPIRARPWLAMAINAAHWGDPTLVPPNWSQPLWP